jgi:hypothetical protein
MTMMHSVLQDTKDTIRLPRIYRADLNIVISRIGAVVQKWHGFENLICNFFPFFQR